MRRPLIAVPILLLAAVAAACSASAAPGWTYAPPTPATSQAAPSGGASAAPSGGASAAPSTAPSGGASAAPSGGGEGTTLNVVASGVAFDKQELSAPASAFVIKFDNQDAGIQHNVEIKDANNQTLFKGDLITGPAQADYQVPALPAGTYTFFCVVHPNMTGTLKVGG